MVDRYREQLEGTQQLLRLRRIKRVLLLFLFVLAIALSAYAMVLEGASAKPLFLPMDGFLSIILVLLFIASLVNFVFRLLEIRHAKRDSQRYLLARNSIRRAWPILILGFVLGVLLVLPVTTAAARESLRDVRAGEIDQNASVRLLAPNQDAFGITRYLAGRVEAPTAQPNQMLDVVIRWDGGQLGGPVSRNAPLDFSFYSDRMYEYNITITNLNNQVVRFRVTLQGGLMPNLTSVVPAVLLGFGIANGVWIAYARPLSRKYEASSIYSVEYVQETDRGEKTFAEYYRVPSTPAPPPPPTPPPLPQVELAPPPPPEARPEAFPETERTSASLLEEGSHLYSEGQHEAALALFDEVLEREPTNVGALVAGASALHRLGRTDEAMRQYEEVLKVDPRNAKALYDRAAILEARREWARAADAWRDYLGVVPSDIDGRLRRAEALLNTGDRAAAVKALEEALFLSPSDPRIRARIESLTVNVPALLSKALVASASGRYDEALADFDRILAVDPDNVNALVGKGVALRRAGRGEESLAILDVALAKQPGNSAALRAKGAILEERGEFERALDVYEDLLAWNPRDPEVWALQGSVLEKLSEPEEALASYVESLKLEPGNAEWRAKVTVLESSRKGQEALLAELFAIRGMGPARARALLAAGYKSTEALRAATVDEIANVRGMTRKLAEEIHGHFHPEPPPPPPAPPPA